MARKSGPYDIDPDELEDDDWEYYISFPSPPGGSEATRASGIEDTSSLSSYEPVVFIFGWAGSDYKALSLYSNMYEAFGCVTIRYIAPQHNLSGISSDDSISEKMVESASMLLDLLFDYGLESNPVFVHAFSNGGAYTYLHLAEILKSGLDTTSENQSEFAKISLRGVVFDSGPFLPVSLPMKKREITRTEPDNPSFFDIFWSLFSSIVAVFASVLAALIGNLFSSSEPPSLDDELQERLRTNDYIRRLYKDTNTCAQLILYGDDDTLVAGDEISHFCSARLEVSDDVNTHVFIDSSHCSHGKIHFTEYRKACKNFLIDILCPEVPPITATNELTPRGSENDLVAMNPETE